MASVPSAPLSGLPSSSTRLFLVDDHPIFLIGLRARLSAEPGLTVVGEASTLAEARVGLTSSRADVVVVDLSLGKDNGLDLVEFGASLEPRPRFVVVSMHDELQYAELSLRRGAHGYVMKSNSADEVVRAVRDAARERVYVSPEINARILQSLGPYARPTASGIDALSARELEIFRLLGMGISTRDIARTLHISGKTVDTHRLKIKEKLGVATPAELIIRAANWLREQ